MAPLPGLRRGGGAARQEHQPAAVRAAGAVRRHGLLPDPGQLRRGPHRCGWPSHFILLPAGRGAGLLQRRAKWWSWWRVCALFCALSAVRRRCDAGADRIVAGVLACAFADQPERQRSARSNACAQKLAEARKGGAKRRARRSAQRIASDFHDGPLQSFISLQMRLEILRKVMERDLNAGMEDLKQLQALAQSQVRDLRTFLHSMRPVDVDGANLVATARRIGGELPEGERHPGDVPGRRTRPWACPPEMTLGSAADGARGAAQRAEARRRHAGGGGHGEDGPGPGDFGGRQRPRLRLRGTYSLEELELLRLGPASLKRRARSLNADLVLESRPGRGAGNQVPRFRCNDGGASWPRMTGEHGGRLIVFICVLAGLLLFAGCGRYADFTLPRWPAAATRRWPSAFAAGRPVLARAPAATGIRATR